MGDVTGTGGTRGGAAVRFVPLRPLAAAPGGVLDAADAVIGRAGDAVSAADLDLLMEAHERSGGAAYLEAALRGALAVRSTEPADRYRDAFVAAAGRGVASLAGPAAELAEHLAALPQQTAGGSIEEACASLAAAVLLDVGDADAALGGLRSGLAGRLDVVRFPFDGGVAGVVALHRVAAAIERTGLLGDGDLGPVRLRVEEALAWLIAPDGDLVPIGGTAPVPMGTAWLRTQRPKSLAQRFSHPALLHAVTRGALGLAPGRGWRVWRGAGLGVARLGGPAGEAAGPSGQVTFAAGGSGRHDDALSVTWHQDGRWLLTDAGRRSGDLAYPPADTPLPRRGEWPAPERMDAYLASAVAHTTLSGAGEDSRLVRWGECGGVLTADGADGSGRRRRSIAYGGDWLVLVDEAAAPRTEAVVRSFHAPADLLVQRAGRGFVMSAAGEPVCWVTSVGDRGRALRPVTAGTGRTLRGWSTAPGGRPVPAWDFGWHHRGPFRAATLLTTSGPPSDRAFGDGAVSWSAGGRRITLTLDEVGIGAVREEPA